MNLSVIGTKDIIQENDYIYWESEPLKLPNRDELFKLEDDMIKKCWVKNEQLTNLLSAYRTDQDLKEYMKKYRETNNQIIQQQTKEYREQNKKEIQQYGKEYYKQNKEKILLQKKDYNDQHKNERKIYNQKYREQNKEYYSQYNKQYNEKNKEIRNLKNKEKVTCDMCNKEMNSSSLNKHKKRKHLQV